MAAHLSYNGRFYEGETAVKCENDRYVRLFDANGVEVVSFYDIADFSEFYLSGCEWTTPDDCAIFIPARTYSSGKIEIGGGDWIYSSNDSRYHYAIENPLISANKNTCNIFINFAPGTNFKYTAEQEEGKLIIYPDSRPESLTINNIFITRV